MTRRAGIAAAEAAEVERAYVADQLRDFGRGGWSAEAAMQEVAARFDVLLKHEIAAALDPGNASLARATSPEAWVERTRFYHRVLFDGLLSNAGVFRRLDDVWQGAVGYGGASARTLSEKFEGVPPAEIERRLADAFSLLRAPVGDPVAAAARAYQRFVFVHPFYDANGRIGRIVVSRFLTAHGLWLDWDALGARGAAFHNKLNKVHEHWKRGHERYTGGLAEFLRAFVSDLPADEDAPFDEGEGGA